VVSLPYRKMIRTGPLPGDGRVYFLYSTLDKMFAKAGANLLSLMFMELQANKVVGLLRKRQKTFDLVKSMRANPRPYLLMLRAALDWTMEEGATVIGVSRQTWAGWESGETEIRLVSLEKLVALWKETWEEEGGNNESTGE